MISTLINNIKCMRVSKVVAIFIAIIIIGLLSSYFFYFKKDIVKLTTNEGVTNYESKDFGTPVSYTNDLLDFSITNPDGLYLTEFSNGLEQLSHTRRVVLACMGNYSPDIELHPQQGEIVICFNALFRSNMNLSDWYAIYNSSNFSNHYNYESVAHEELTINGYHVIKEKITTGAQPTQNVGTEWIKGEQLNYYIITGDYVLQIESIVHIDDSSLLHNTTNIIKSINLK